MRQVCYRITGGLQEIDAGSRVDERRKPEPGIAFGDDAGTRRLFLRGERFPAGRRYVRHQQVGIARKRSKVLDVNIFRIDVGIEIERPMHIRLDQEVVFRFLRRELPVLNFFDQLG
jgi:hypothetical protein